MNHTNKIVDLITYNQYNAQEQMKGNMNMNQVKLTREEKRKIVDGVNTEVKNTNKPIYRVCTERHIALYNYYNWSKSLMMFDAKQKTKLNKKQARLDKQEKSKQALITDFGVKQFKAPEVKSYKAPQHKVITKGAKCAVIVTNTSNLEEILAELF